MKKKTNTLSLVVRCYALINCMIGLIIALCGIEGEGMGALSALVIGITLAASIGLFAFGEVIDLLQDIKNNTEK